MTEQELTGLCSIYQEILRMRDWRIEVRITSNLPHDKDNTVGNCDFSIENQTGIIYVTTEADFNKDGEQLVPYDPEQIMVHELMHIRMNLTGGDPITEFALDSTAEAIVNLRRLTHEKFERVVERTDRLQSLSTAEEHSNGNKSSAGSGTGASPGIPVVANRIEHSRR